MPTPGVEIFPGDSSTAQRFTAAVSLHSHTEHSLEGLSFIPDYARSIPSLSGYFQAGMERFGRAHGQALDFENAFWTPPLSAPDVVAQEIVQIEKRLNRHAVISITDHDNLLAAASLRKSTSPCRDAALSLEWSVPFRGSLFHIGVHNLPPDEAPALLARFNAYTANPQDADLREILSALDRHPQTLVVLNHPRWDLPRSRKAGTDAHLRALELLGEQCGQWIHAVEINGYQSWEENKQVLLMANELGFPVVAGGDRHGASPNTMLNLTNAKTLPEFISEVREGKRTAVLVMPSYRESFRLRRLSDVSDVLRTYPLNAAGRRDWSERVLFGMTRERIEQLSVFWPCGRPLWMTFTLGILRLMGGPFRCLLRPLFLGEKIDIPEELLEIPLVGVPALAESEAE